MHVRQRCVEKNVVVNVQDVLLHIKYYIEMQNMRKSTVISRTHRYPM